MDISLTDNNNKSNKTLDISSSVNQNRQKILADHTIVPNDLKWGEKLRNYKKLKDIFNYESKVFPRHITTKMIVDAQRQFNPITQKYYDEKNEKKICEISKNNSLSMMSNGYDRQLEVESTYNIINLKSKLGRLNINDSQKKNNSGYNQNQFNYEKNNIKPYNILSNLSLRKHNYVSPEFRPSNDDKLINSQEGLIFKERNNNNKLSMSMEHKYSRDYDIINNRYKLFNDEKIETERKIQNLMALKKTKNSKKYDIIKMEYPDTGEAPTSDVKNKKLDKNFIVRNPINNMIYDEKEQKRLDQIEYNKKKRFEAKDKLDNFRHSVRNNIEEKMLIDQQKYFNPFEYKILNKRGYDALTNEVHTLSELNKNLTEIQNKKLITDWDKLKNGSDKNNNTFKSKKIYKSEYDDADVDINYSNYMKLRKPILNQRCNTLDNEQNNNDKNSFLLRTPVPNKKNRNYLSKSIEETIGNSCNKVHNKMENRIDYKMEYNKMNKDLFFGTPKTVLRKKQNFQYINY
jgi:hypothetical protein